MAFEAGQEGASPLKPGARAARAAGLHYTSDSVPGVSRRRTRGGGHAYYRPQGARIRDPALIRRFNALAIPPAYTDVWICPDPRGHLQATGRDAKGRKQYRYHPLWQAEREASKYQRMLAFGKALPRLRARVRADLRLPGVSRRKVLATVVRLLECTLIRVGNGEYARANRSYGLTTLCDRHVDVRGAQIRFTFRGKSGVLHDITINDPRLARTLRRCLEMPGKELFQYYDEEGRSCAIQSADVNDYLHEISGADFTAKDYRTWVGSVLAMRALLRLPAGSKRAAQRNIAQALRSVAERMGNTPAVCRKSYVHPALLEAYAAGWLAAAAGKPSDSGRAADEALFLRFLKSLGSQGRGRRSAAATGP